MKAYNEEILQKNINNNLSKNNQNNTEQAVNYTDLLASVLKSIYWLKFTANQQIVITNIIKDNELNNMGKANEICEFLGIEKRGNRSAIVDVLNGC
jgi:hypothetical protein